MHLLKVHEIKTTESYTEKALTEFFIINRMALFKSVVLLGKLSVLVLAGVKLVFFTVARMRLCFGFALETVVIMQECFPYC